jgi:excisionase family DNA binding protein
LSCSRRTIRRAIDKGAIAVVRVGDRTLRIPESALAPRVKEGEQ